METGVAGVSEDVVGGDVDGQLLLVLGLLIFFISMFMSILMFLLLIILLLLLVLSLLIITVLRSNPLAFREIPVDGIVTVSDTALLLSTQSLLTGINCLFLLTPLHPLLLHNPHHPPIILPHPTIILLIIIILTIITIDPPPLTPHLLHLPFLTRPVGPISRLIKIHEVCLDNSQLLLVVTEVGFHALDRVENRGGGF